MAAEKLPCGNVNKQISHITLVSAVLKLTQFYESRQNGTGTGHGCNRNELFEMIGTIRIPDEDLFSPFLPAQSDGGIRLPHHAGPVSIGDTVA